MSKYVYDSIAWGIFISIYVIGILIGININMKIRRRIILVIDILALLVFIIFFSLWQKVVTIFALFSASVCATARANWHNGLTEPIDIKKCYPEALLFLCGISVFMLAYIFTT